jgi:hypothetical protein
VSELAVQRREQQAGDSRPRVYVGALFPEDLHRDLCNRAEANDRSVSAELRRAVSSYLTVGQRAAGSAA